MSIEKNNNLSNQKRWVFKRAWKPVEKINLKKTLMRLFFKFDVITRLLSAKNSLKRGKTW